MSDGILYTYRSIEDARRVAQWNANKKMERFAIRQTYSTGAGEHEYMACRLSDPGYGAFILVEIVEPERARV